MSRGVCFWAGCANTPSIAFSTSPRVTSDLADDILTRICEENLAVYRASPVRLKEDVAQEDEVASNYRGRLVYELLQNADDAMADGATPSDRIVFRLTDDDLWVGNSGRPLSEDDVKGLCGIGASTKSESEGPRRATIGHKGMGFKSVLEVTDAPEALSTNHSLRLGAALGLDAVGALFADAGEPGPRKVPAMRFPRAISSPPDYWRELADDGIRTLFRFPLRSDLGEAERDLLSERLLGFPITSILFLKHLEHVDVRVERGEEIREASWELTRERKEDGGWTLCPGLTGSGLYRVKIDSPIDAATFLVAHDADIEIGRSRGGLSAQVWEGIELSEVSVAAQLESDHPIGVRSEWRKFHIFLPTGEICPYPFLVNGAFSSDLSRRDIRIGEGSGDYNRHLLQCCARLFRDRLVPGLQDTGSSATEILRLLDREVEPREPAEREPAQALYEAMRDALSAEPFLDAADTEGRLSLGDCIVPPLVSDETVGSELRDLLPASVRWEGRRFPTRELCGSRYARIAVDHGAVELTHDVAPRMLAASDLSEVALKEHESGGYYVDPVLSILERLWASLETWRRQEFVQAVREEALFPVDERAGMVERVTTDGRECFYPPRTLKGTVPLQGLSFLMQDVCWGALSAPERNAALRSQMTAWTALFGLREFKFPDVMRASVLPALALGIAADDPRRASLCSFDVLAAICQLSGRTPNPAAPLPYERLGPNRALFNLARLPVPSRTRTDDKFVWRPAYTVYLGEDWVGQESIEHVLSAMRSVGATPPEIPLLAPPTELIGRLAQFSHLRDTEEDLIAAGEEGEDEVALDEDEEQPLDSDEHDQWLRFLTWIGVNRGLRQVHFHDVEDRNSGWLTTENLTRPRGRAFERVPQELWNAFRENAGVLVGEHQPSGSEVAYFYRLHDLDHAASILATASQDPSNSIGKALFEHLALNWPQLQRYTRAQFAVVPGDRAPSRRTAPARAKEDELSEAGDDFWLWRLRGQEFCPTSHGPRAPRRAWLPSSEIERRFGRRGSDPAQLLPLLELSRDLPVESASNLARVLGVRGELTPSSFEAEDARVILDRIERIWASTAVADRERVLRQVIRPAYRNLIELLPGAEDDLRAGYVEGALSGSPLLVENGRGDVTQSPVWVAIACRVRSARPTFSTMTGLPAAEARSRAAANRSGARTVSMKQPMTAVCGSSTRYPR